MRKVLSGYMENIFTVRVDKHWKRSPREAEESSTLNIFKTQLDKALSNLT